MSQILLNRANLLNNLEVISNLCPNSIIAPCLKANAYGHGLLEIASILAEYDKTKIKIETILPNEDLLPAAKTLWFTLSSVSEAQKVRALKISTPILILNSLTARDIEKALDIEQIRLSLYSKETVKLAGELSQKAGKNLKVHLQIDTGMHWLGILPNEAWEMIKLVMQAPFLELEGIWTHFASSENLDNPFFEEQLETFLKLKKQLKQKLQQKYNFEIKLWHCANSGAILRNFPQKSEFNLVQPGKILYGSYATGVMKIICQKQGIFLRPVLTWQTEITQIKTLQNGDFIGYDQTYQCQQDMTIAVLPVGYSDGLNRQVSGEHETKGYVLINGIKCYFVGRICMNLAMVVLPKQHKFEVGQKVILIGQSLEKLFKTETKKSNSALELKNQSMSKINLINSTKNQEKTYLNSEITEIPLGLIASWCGTIGRVISTGLHPDIDRIVI